MVRRKDQNTGTWLFDTQVTIPGISLNYVQERLVQSFALTIVGATTLWATLGEIIRDSIKIDKEIQEEFSHEVRKETRQF